jgi:Flp pilus assembly protein TadG
MRSANRKKKGQSLVEFMLLGMIFLLLAFGAWELGRIVMAQNILVGAAREAVRVYALDPATGGGAGPARARAADILGSAGITPYQVLLGDDGVTVTATVRYTYHVVVAGLIPGLPNDVSLNSSTSMRREY